MEDKNSLLIKQIQEISEKNNRLFGYRKMTMKINKISEKPVNHKRIYRLMSLLDLQSVYRPRKRYPKNANKQQTAKNVLKRQFETSKPNEVWVTDITEIHIPGLPKLYLSSIVDLYDRSIWYYVKFEDNLNFCFLTNPKKFVPLSIDYGSLSLRTHFLLLFKLPALAAA